MKFEVYKTSDIFLKENKFELEINTLEELQSLYKKEGNTELIINFNEKYIEIYDDYRE